MGIGMRRNDFVGNNSRMSIDRPKPANSNTVTQVKVFHVCESVTINVSHLKQQKRHLCNAMLVVIRFIKVSIMILTIDSPYHALRAQ